MLSYKDGIVKPQNASVFQCTLSYFFIILHICLYITKCAIFFPYKMGQLYKIKHSEGVYSVPCAHISLSNLFDFVK